MSETNGELSGSKAPGQSLDLRTARLAQQAGEKAAAQAKELLDRHSDIISPDVAEIVGSREFSRAAEAAKEARAEGRMNDQASRVPGVTITITKSGFDGLSGLAEREGSGSYMAEYVSAINPVDTEEGSSEDPEAELYSMRLPQGVYMMGMGGASFYGEAVVEDEDIKSRENPFSMPYDDVVRIEGDGGELWQNVRYNPDGTPKS